MQLYKAKDLELARTKIPDLVNEVDNKKLDIFEPTRDKRNAVNDLIFDFIKENKRKIYGGYAQNKVIVKKNPKDAFYAKDNIADIDFYSPDPITDLMKICNILHEKGYSYVHGREALHKETYTVTFNFVAACDISYIPSNIFHRIPFIEIDGIHYVHPNFTMIDFYREYTDAYHSSFRWEKTFPRVYLLQKYFPFNRATTSLKPFYKYDPKTKDLLKFLFDYMQGKDTFVLFGNYAYNKYLTESGIMKDKTLGKKYKLLDVPFYEVISTNYVQDGKDIYDKLKETFPDMKEDLTIVELYPFWSFLGYSAFYFYKDIPILFLTYYNRRCIPFQSTKDKMKISAYAHMILMTLILKARQRTLKDRDGERYYNIMLSHLIEMRNYYLDKNKKTMFDKTMFQEFIIGNCVGETMDPKVESNLERIRKYRSGKSTMFRYEPAYGVKEPGTTYMFPNSSGNPIRNPRNLQILIPSKKESDIVSSDEPEDVKIETQKKEMKRFRQKPSYEIVDQK